MLNAEDWKVYLWIQYKIKMLTFTIVTVLYWKFYPGQWRET